MNRSAAAAAAAAALWSRFGSRNRNCFLGLIIFFSCPPKKQFFFCSKLIRTTVHTSASAAQVALAPLSCCVPVRLKNNLRLQTGFLRGAPRSPGLRRPQQTDGAAGESESENVRREREQKEKGSGKRERKEARKRERERQQ